MLAARMTVLRRSLLALLGCAVLGACSCGREVPAPPLVRADITPHFGKLSHEDPEAHLLPWQRTHGIVLGDLRAAHALRPGTELLLPVPGGATHLATACAARRTSGADREGEVRIALEISTSGKWREIGAWKGQLAELMGGWSELDLPLEAPAGPREGVRVRGEVSNASTPETIELLVEPLRAVGVRSDPRPNVLVLSIDTLRADHLSCYGYRRATSPRIDALAREGVLFERVVAPAPWTLPSYGSLFTGCTPAVHRAGVNSAKEACFGRDEDRSGEGLEILRADLPTLAERMSAAGWATAGFQANSFLRAKNGVDRGFSRWVFYQYRSDFGIALALRWIEDHRAAPWMCFLHVMDVHQPYVPTPPFDRRFSARSHADVADYPPPIDVLRAGPPEESVRQFLIDQYDGAIAAADDRFGEMLDRLKAMGELDRTLVVVHSDHGEEFWEHGGYEHGHDQREEVLAVPLVLWKPGMLPAGSRVGARVRLLDLMPTLLDLLRIEPPGGIEGRSLVPLIEGRTEPARECVSEATLHGAREIKALTLGPDRLELRGAGPGRLYDLEKDPGEATDLRAGRIERAREMEERLLKRHAALLRSAVRAGAMQLTEEDWKRLRDLGYTTDD